MNATQSSDSAHTYDQQIKSEQTQSQTQSLGHTEDASFEASVATPILSSTTPSHLPDGAARPGEREFKQGYQEAWQHLDHLDQEVRKDRSDLEGEKERALEHQAEIDTEQAEIRAARLKLEEMEAANRAKVQRRVEINNDIKAKTLRVEQKEAFVKLKLDAVLKTMSDLRNLQFPSTPDNSGNDLTNLEDTDLSKHSRSIAGERSNPGPLAPAISRPVYGDREVRVDEAEDRYRPETPITPTQGGLNLSHHAARQNSEKLDERVSEDPLQDGSNKPPVLGQNVSKTPATAIIEPQGDVTTMSKEDSKTLELIGRICPLIVWWNHGKFIHVTCQRCGRNATPFRSATRGQKATPERFFQHLDGMRKHLKSRNLDLDMAGAAVFEHCNLHVISDHTLNALRNGQTVIAKFTEATSVDRISRLTSASPQRPLQASGIAVGKRNRGEGTTRRDNKRIRIDRPYQLRAGSEVNDSGFNNKLSLQ